MQPREPEGVRYTFDIFADYHQVYLEDCEVAETRSEGLRQQLGETPEQFAARMQRLEQDAARIAVLLSPEARARHLGIAHGTLCIMTARMLDVPVTVELRESGPADEWAEWDSVVEASLDLPSGCLVLHGPTDSTYDSPRIALAPDTYRARAHYGGIATVSADALDGQDHYYVAIWPAPYRGPVVLHSSHSVGW